MAGAALSSFESLVDARVPSGLGGRWYGVYPALVESVKDESGQGRVKVSLPWAPDAGGEKYEAWARLATLMGGKNRGSFFIPDKDDEVLVCFEGGDPGRPYVVGGLWNGKDSPPERMDGAGKNDKKVLRSRNGVKVTLDDTNGQEKLILETPGGQKVTLRDGPGSIKLEDSNGNAVKLEASGITITTTAKLTLQASTVEVSSSLVNVNAGTSKFSALVKSDSIITNSIISASYTPGAGNIW